MSSPHASHPGIIARLKRAHGHLAKVIAMIEAGSPCVELAQQLHAVERALVQAKSALIHDHINACLDHVLAAKPGKGAVSRVEDVKAFKEITRYL